MPDITMAELKRKRDKREKKVRFIGERNMISGKRLADGSVTLVGAPTGKTWVRGSDDSREETSVWGYCGVANASIKIAPNSSTEFEIVGVDYPESVERMGDAVHIITAAPPLDEIVPHSINGGGFKPGRLEPSQLGGLFVHVSDFWHSGGMWQGNALIDGEADPTFPNDFAVSSFEPATAGEVGWVYVYLDPATNTLAAVAGTPIFGEQQDLFEADLDAITLPDGVYPLGAFAFRNGMTAIDSTTRIVHPRQFLNSTGGIQSVVAGSNVTVDNTDPLNPVIGASGGGGGSLSPFLVKSTTLASTTSTTLTPLDATNIGYSQFSYTLAVGDMVECILTGQFYNNSGSIYGWFDLEIDQPTSADIYLNAASSSGTPAFTTLMDTNRRLFTVVLTFVATEAGVHAFRPAWKTNSGTLEMGNDATPGWCTTKLLGQ